MIKTEDNAFRFILSEIIELRKWLKDNKKFEPRVIRTAAAHYLSARESQVAKAAKRYMRGQGQSDELSQKAQSAVTEFLAQLDPPPLETAPHDISGLPGATIITTNQGDVVLIWYDPQDGQVKGLCGVDRR